MKTPDINDPRLGKIFTIVRIEPQRSGQIVAVLSDGTQLPVESLNANFNMLSDPSMALPESDVRAMHARLKQASPLSPKMLATLEPEQRNVVEQKMLQQPAAVSSNVDLASPAATQPVPVRIASNQQPQQIDLAKSLFGMFTLTPTDLEFLIPVKLPTLDLIQMMYAQATDKDEFLTNFSTYVLQNIDLDAVKKAMSSLMEPKPKKIRAPK